MLVSSQKKASESTDANENNNAKKQSNKAKKLNQKVKKNNEKLKKDNSKTEQISHKIVKSIQDLKLKDLEDKNSSIDSDSNMEDFYSPTGRLIDRKL